MSLFPGYGDSDEDNQETFKVVEEVVDQDISLPDKEDKKSRVKRKRSKSPDGSDLPSDSSNSERYKKKKKEDRKSRDRHKKEKKKKHRRRHSSYSSNDEKEDDRRRSHKKKKSPSRDKKVSKIWEKISYADELKSEKVKLTNNQLISNSGNVEKDETTSNNTNNDLKKKVVKSQAKTSLKKEKEDHEAKLKLERDLLKTLIDDNPKDLEVWLKFIKLQDEESRFRGHSITVASDLKLAIIENALKNVGSKCVELKIEKLKCLTDLEDYSIAIKQWDIYLIQHPNSLLLWEYIINSTLFTFSRFSVYVSLQIMVDCYNTLAKLLRSEIITHKPEPGTEVFLGDLLIRIIKLHFQFGYTEVGVSLISSFIEFNFFKPTFLANKSHKESIELFTKFWNCKCPKAGFEGAIGWNNCYSTHSNSMKLNTFENQMDGLTSIDGESMEGTSNTDDYLKEEDEYCLLAKKEGYPLSKIWFTVENIREKHNYSQFIPGDYDNGDKDRHVDFKKSILYSLFTFSSKTKEYIMRQILKVFKVNIDRVLGEVHEPDIYSLFGRMNVKLIDTHPPYESLKFLERLFKFLGERRGCKSEELEKIVFGIYKIIVRYGKNLEYESKGNEKFAKILKDNFINNISMEYKNKKEKCIDLTPYLDELFYDSRFMNNIDLTLKKIDIKVLSIIYQPVVSDRDKLILKKAIFNYCRRCFTKVDLVNHIASFLMTGSVNDNTEETNNDVNYKDMASEKLFTLHNDKEVHYNFFCDWKLDDLKYISGLVMILKYQMSSDVNLSLDIIKFLERKYSYERLERLEEIFLLQEEIYADYYEKQNKVYEPAYDIFIVESMKKYPKFINLLMVYLRRSSSHKSINIESIFIESLQISKLHKMVAIIYNELLIYQKEFNQYLKKDTNICPNFDKLRKVIFKYADSITKITLSPIVWKLLLQLEHKYGSKESLRRSFFKGLESVGWSKDFYMDYLLYDPTSFDDVFQLFIEKGFRIRCLKEELPVLLQ
uniref:D-aminoacyl-tRNA deacylase n=2 Tax=Strongyloides stercoralis TaxID=6248 RepID=A0AAF5HXA8_STRER